jgi:lysozyme
MNPDNKKFIEDVAKFAVSDYVRSKVLPSITIAQAILESGWGKSGLTKQTNNLFGIKGKFKGKGKVFKTREVYNGKETFVNAEFRAYPSFEGSIQDHNDLLMKPRYAKVIAAKDYKTAAREIRLAGYATDPKYTELLIRIIEQYKLFEYDKKAMEPKKPKAPMAEPAPAPVKVAVANESKSPLSVADAEVIIKILNEKHIEGQARQDDKMKKEMDRLIVIVKKLSGLK